MFWRLRAAFGTGDSDRFMRFSIDLKLRDVCSIRCDLVIEKITKKLRTIFYPSGVQGRSGVGLHGFEWFQAIGNARSAFQALECSKSLNNAID